MKLSSISESTEHDKALADLLRELRGQVPDSLFMSIQKLHDKRNTYHSHVNVSNVEIYQQLLNGERLIGMLEPHLDEENNQYPPDGVSDCGVEMFPSEDGNKYLVGPVAVQGYEQLWQDLDALPRPSTTRSIAEGLLFGYDPIEVQKFIEQGTARYRSKLN